VVELVAVVEELVAVEVDLVEVELVVVELVAVVEELVAVDVDLVEVELVVPEVELIVVLDLVKLVAFTHFESLVTSSVTQMLQLTEQVNIGFLAKSREREY